MPHPILNSSDSQSSNRVTDIGPVPTDPGSNWSYAFTRAGPSSAVDTITKVKDGISYRRTLTYTGSNVTAVSVWVKL